MPKQPPSEFVRCIILTRVSTDAQGENTSHDTQNETCTRFAQDRGWHVVARFHETESGALYHARVETQAALTMLERDEADMLLLYDMSRYGRDVEFQHKMLKRITRVRKQLQFTTLRLEYDPYSGDLTPESQHIFTTFGSTTQMERSIIKRRTSAGRLKAAREGRLPSRSYHPLGYHIPTKVDIYRGLYAPELEGKPQVVESERETARSLFEIYDRLESVRGTAAEHWERGFRSRSGLPMRPSALTGILINPIYKGEAQYGRYRYYTDDERVTQGKNKKYRSKDPEPDAPVVPCEALVSPELWERVNRKLKEGREKRSGPKHRYMLTGLVLCPICGRKCLCLWRSLRSAKAKAAQELRRSVGIAPREYALRCQGRFKPTTVHESYCSVDSYSGPLVEHIVVEALRYLVSLPHAMEKASEQYHSKAAQRVTQSKREQGTLIRELEREIEALTKREKVAVTAAIDARLSDGFPAAYEAAAADAARSRVELETRLAALTVEAPRLEKVLLPPFDLNSILEGLADQTIPGAERGRALAQIVEAVYPLPLSYALGEVGQGDKLGGVALLLKTGHAPPYFVLWYRITKRRRVFAAQNFVEGKIALEVMDTLSLPPQRPDGRLSRQRAQKSV